MDKQKIPSKKECLDILKRNKTPSNVIEHSRTVCKLAEDVAEKLIKKGIKVNKKLLAASALLHDIEREKDNHVIVGAELLKSMGFSEISEIIRKHSLYKIEDEEVQPKTVEEKILFYADKKVKGNEIVSLEERLKDAERRYNVDLKNEFEFCKKIEKELLD